MQKCLSSLHIRVNLTRTGRQWTHVLWSHESTFSLLKGQTEILFLDIKDEKDYPGSDQQNAVVLGACVHDVGDVFVSECTTEGHNSIV